MKINEKVVSYFQACNSPVDKEGYLSKKGEIKTSYQKRWFVLKGNLLFYKDRPSDRDVIGVIVLEGCTVQLCESEEQFAFSLVWSEPGLRTYKFAAEDQASQESWIKALLSSSHSYLSLLVMDMEKKYRDALRTSAREPAKPFIMPNFNAPQSNYPAAQSSYPAQGAPLSSSQQIQVLARAASKQSSKQYQNMVPDGTRALEMSNFFLGTENDFHQLHEEFGKEIKILITGWSKKKHRGQVFQEEDLMNFD